MSAITRSPLRQPRVPAWKRLGLKLKYAREDAEPHSLPGTGSTVNLQTSIGDAPQRRPSNDYVRLRENRNATPEAPHDSQELVTNGTATDSYTHGRQQATTDERTSGSREELLGDRDDHESQSVNDAPPQRQANQTQEPAEDTSSKPRRKSVSFTTDTKREDGFGASALFQQWGTEQEPEPDHTVSQLSQPQPKKAKKHKKRAQGPGAQVQFTGEDDKTVNSSPPEYVQYLLLFHTDRPSWKFNKKKQKDLLKNLFHVDRVPAEHTEAVLQYIAGLQGAGARQRVVESATTVLKEIAERTSDVESEQDMESEEARRTAYSAALRRHLEKYERAKVEGSEYDDQQIEEMQREAERGKRAEAVLGELLWKELHPNEVPPASLKRAQNSTAPSAKTNEIQTPGTTTSTASTSKSISKRKRRKMRTQVTTDDSSSSESDSETSNESEGDFNPKRGPATVSAALSTQSDPQLKHPPKKISPTAPPKKKVFDDAFLDGIFPKKRSYHDTAPKRKAGSNGTVANKKARGFAYTHGTRADESGSEDE